MTKVRVLEGLDRYPLRHVSEHPEEVVRLDMIHDAFTAFFGGKLTPVSLESDPPESVLDMGAGSGAWAAQAGETFPQAEVVAVDLAEIPRTLPANVTFCPADLTKPFSFTPDQFDVIHARLLFVNLPDFKFTFTHAIDTVKPGGWFIIEDVILMMYEEDPADDSNSVLTRWHNAWKEVMKDRDIDNWSSLKYESLLKESGAFSEINVTKLKAPLSGQTDDPILRQFGAAIRNTINILYPQFPGRLSDPRLTDSMAQETLAVVNDENKKVWMDFNIIWARKHL